MAQDNVQYGYAIQDALEKVIGIDTLTRESSSAHKYYCPHCHGEMYPTFGYKQVHHFRHSGAQCQHDNYLHSVAEKVFQEEYQKCLENKEPFILELHSHVDCDRNCTEKKNDKCTHFYNANSIDLTKIYNEVKLETNVDLEDGRYRRPDILLFSDSGEQLWIEIWVKHETQEDKRKDGHIIELRINSEKDLEPIKNHRLAKTTDSEFAIRLFNVGFREEFIVSNSIHNCQTCTNFHERIMEIPYYTSRKLKHKPQVGADCFDGLDSIEWVNLGLPSGILWAKENSGLLLPFNIARKNYICNLPSWEEAEELRRCKRSWDSEMNAIRITGPNGNSIYFRCKERNVSYWLKDYADRRREFGQCFHLGQDKTFYINDKDTKSLACIRLVKRVPKQICDSSETTLF